jgi:ATP adenylyltransferase
MATLQNRINVAAAAAQRDGIIVPLHSEVVSVTEQGLDFVISHLSSLSLKAIATAAQKAAGANPFLPYEPGLFVAELSPSHVLLLNKFPMAPGHVIAVTREFVPQVAPLRRADFEVMATLLGELGGMLMYNGGAVAGASQPHRHMHLLPLPSLPLTPGFPRGPDHEFLLVPEFRFVHAFARISLDKVPARQRGASLEALFGAAMQRCNMVAGADSMPAYDLLATRKWLLLVPRTREHWRSGAHSVSINALNFGGMFGVHGPELIEVVRAAGLLNILRAVSIPVD